MTKKHKIMLVEDNDNVRLSVRRVLERLNYDVDDFAHGFSAHGELYRLAKDKIPIPYAAILSDIDMPHMDGKEFARESALLTPNTPLILMSGRYHEDIPKNVKEVLEKPLGLTKQNLERTLTKYLHR